MLANESNQEKFTSDETQSQEEESQSYYIALKSLNPQEWVDLYKFREASPEVQELTPRLQVAKYTDLLLTGFESLSEIEYPIKPQDSSGSVRDNGERTLDRKEERCIPKINLWDKSTATEVQRANQSIVKYEKSLSKNTQKKRKEALIEAFLAKDNLDNFNKGSLLFPKQALLSRTPGSKITKVLHLKKTLAEEYDYHLARDKEELRIQNQGLSSSEEVVEAVI